MCRSRLVSPESKVFTGTADEEFTFSGVANAFAAGGLAHAVGLVKGMRDVVGNGALLQDPLLVGGKQGRDRETDEYDRQHSLVHKL
jgi:hypothetical protein